MKPGIYFIQVTNGGERVVINMHIDSSWSDLLGAFKRFILASGYVLPGDGSFEFVEEEG